MASLPVPRSSREAFVNGDAAAGMDDLAVVRAVDLPPEEVERARGVEAAIVILPLARAADGRGVYGQSTVFLAKDLRAEGLDATYLDASGNRVFEELNGVISDALLNISLGITGNAAWEGLKALLRREQATHRKMEITYTDLTPGGTGKSWNVRGHGEDVLRAIDKLRGDPTSDET
jgi:hypothetical protein